MSMLRSYGDLIVSLLVVHTLEQITIELLVC